METLQETVEYPLPRTEMQRRELRNAMARSRLELIREEKDLHQFLTEVWEEPNSNLLPGR